MENIINIDKLNKSYKVADIFDRIKGDKIKVGVNNVSFNVKKGEVFSVIGLNGAGKTTIMKSILGLIEPDSGKIEVFGRDKLKREDFYNIGYLPEISYYPKDIKLKTLIDFYGDLYNMSRKEKNKKIMESLEILGISSRINDKLEKFSKGMVQRVGIAQAIMNSPKLLLLDEPMSGLDPKGRIQIMELITKLKKEGTTIVLNTHILSDVEKIGDRIAIIHNGYVKDILDVNCDKLRKTGNHIITIANEYKEFQKNGEFYEKMVGNNEFNKILKKLIENNINIVSIKIGRAHV